MIQYHRDFEHFRVGSTNTSSPGLSRVASSSSFQVSRASSRMSFQASSRASSPISLAPSDLDSRPSSSMSLYSSIGAEKSDEEDFPPNPILSESAGASSVAESFDKDTNPFPAPAMRPESPALAPSTYATKVQSGPMPRKGRSTGAPGHIKISRQLKVCDIIPISEIPATWTVPRIPTAYLVDVLASTKLLTTEDGNISSLDTHIRAEVWSSGLLPLTTLLINSTGPGLMERIHWTCERRRRCIRACVEPQSSGSLPPLPVLLQWSGHL
jgi:hypothetical protein